MDSGTWHKVCVFSRWSRVWTFCIFYHPHRVADIYPVTFFVLSSSIFYANYRTAEHFGVPLRYATTPYFLQGLLKNDPYIYTMMGYTKTQPAFSWQDALHTCSKSCLALTASLLPDISAKLVSCWLVSLSQLLKSCSSCWSWLCSSTAAFCDSTAVCYGKKKRVKTNHIYKCILDITSTFIYMWHHPSL